MKQIVCIGGFGWKHGDDRAGWETFIERVGNQEANAIVESYQWNADNLRERVELNKTRKYDKLVMCGRSWGAARIYKFADDNPDVTIDLAITFDPIPNPMWMQFGKWKRRPNIKRVVSFLQHENVLLRGRRIERPRVCIDARILTPGLDKIGFRSCVWMDEYLMPNDRKVPNILGHIMITKNSWICTKALETIAEIKDEQSEKT